MKSYSDAIATSRATNTRYCTLQSTLRRWSRWWATALYGEHGIWVRPASMWNETVERDGKIYQRFTYVEDQEG